MGKAAGDSDSAGGAADHGQPEGPMRRSIESRTAAAASQEFQVASESRPAEQAQASGSRAPQQVRSFKLPRAANDLDSQQLGAYGG